MISIRTPKNYYSWNFLICFLNFRIKLVHFFESGSTKTAEYPCTLCMSREEAKVQENFVFIFYNVILRFVKWILKIMSFPIHRFMFILMFITLVSLFMSLNPHFCIFHILSSVSKFFNSTLILFATFLLKLFLGYCRFFPFHDDEKIFYFSVPFLCSSSYPDWDVQKYQCSIQLKMEFFIGIRLNFCFWILAWL